MHQGPGPAVENSAAIENTPERNLPKNGLDLVLGNADTGVVNLNLELAAATPTANQNSSKVGVLDGIARRRVSAKSLNEAPNFRNSDAALCFRAGQLVRMLDVPADRGMGFGGL